MKTIGIYTFFGVPNCGAYAQAYALRNYISSLLPEFNTVQIAYLHDDHKKLYEMGDANASHKNKQINKLFYDCCKLIPNISINDEEELRSKKFDCIILGSDMIWDFSIDAYGKDRFLFGLDFCTDYKFSYAPSFGMCKPEWRIIPQYVIDGIMELDNISVRDRNSVQIVKNISGRDATLVLDPIWLWNWNADSRVHTYDDEPYIFVYGEDFDDEFCINLRAYANENKLKLIAHGNGEYDLSWCDVVLDDSTTDPFAVIGLFKSAKYIATSTFHGVMFSIYFNKRMAYFKKDFVESKVKDFLEDINIYDYYVDPYDLKRMLNLNWNFDEINRRISVIKRDSVDYISSNLKKAGLIVE